MQKSIFTQEYTALRAALRHAREQAGLSQRDLAERLTVPHSWVAKVEVGERRLDLIETCHFLRACEVDVYAVLHAVAEQCIMRKRPRFRGDGR